MRKLLNGIIAAGMFVCAGNMLFAQEAKKADVPGKKKLSIAMIAKSSTNPVFLSARNGAEAAARDLSAKYGIDVKIDWRTPPTEDGQVQAQRIAQAVNEGTDVILISCSDAGKVTGAINDAVARGVPVMIFDSDAPLSKRFARYGVDDVKTGEKVMSELAKQINGKGARLRFSQETRMRQILRSAPKA
ncbi:MAG: substrate-binding domain-containing protein [Lentisphaerae bacterium]|nr:substrate-binding domain-containing protein [Lentisphaerota bacterium]